MHHCKKCINSRTLDCYFELNDSKGQLLCFIVKIFKICSREAKLSSPIMSEN